MEHLKSVLCAVDLSECSKCALEQASRIARRDGATLAVLHVIEPRVLEDLEEMMPEGSDVRKGVLDGAMRELEKFGAGVVPPNTKLEVVAGEPIDTILAKAKEVAAQLIVIGAFGVTGAGRGAGSLALKMARKSPISVLLVDGRHAADFRAAMSASTSPRSPPARSSRRSTSRGSSAARCTRSTSSRRRRSTTRRRRRRHRRPTSGSSRRR